jgi:hypothetical protein
MSTQGIRQVALDHGRTLTRAASSVPWASKFVAQESQVLASPAGARPTTPIARSPHRVLELEAAVAAGEPDRLGGGRSIEDMGGRLEYAADPDRDQDDDDGHHLTAPLRKDGAYAATTRSRAVTASISITTAVAGIRSQSVGFFPALRHGAH